MKTHYLMVQIVIGSVKLRSWLYFKKESLQVLEKSQKAEALAKAFWFFSITRDEVCTFY